MKPLNIPKIAFFFLMAQHIRMRICDSFIVTDSLSYESEK